MKNLEQITKMNWFDYLLLKSIGDEEKSTKEIIAGLKVSLPIYYPGKQVSRVLFTQRLDFLVELGIVKKVKGNVNFYQVKSECKMQVNMLLMGFTGLFDYLNKEEGKR